MPPRKKKSAAVCVREKAEKRKAESAEETRKRVWLLRGTAKLPYVSQMLRLSAVVGTLFTENDRLLLEKQNILLSVRPGSPHSMSDRLRLEKQSAGPGCPHSVSDRLRWDRQLIVARRLAVQQRSTQWLLGFKKDKPARFFSDRFFVQTFLSVSTQYKNGVAHLKIHSKCKVYCSQNY